MASVMSSWTEQIKGNVAMSMVSKLCCMSNLPFKNNDTVGQKQHIPLISV